MTDQHISYSEAKYVVGIKLRPGAHRADLFAFVLYNEVARNDEARPLTPYTGSGAMRFLPQSCSNSHRAVTVARTYDADGRLTARSGSLTLDGLTYEATGRVVGGTVKHPATQTTLTLSLGYNALGALQYAAGNTPGVTYEEYKTDALGNRLWVRDPDMVDGIDRTKYHTMADAAGQLTASGLGTGTCAPPGAAKPSCHPAWYQYEFNQAHDAAGNVAETWGKDTRGTSAFNAAYVTNETRSYYAADQQLTYYNRHVGLTSPGEGTGLFEEYRYDALGRRVLVRSRRVSSCGSPCEAYVQRTVWDGAQVLYEVRSSGNTGVPAATMELEGGVAVGDDANLYGVVAYAHAGGIDQPAGVLKRYGGSTTWGYVTPHANYQGVWSYGTFRNGATCVAFGQQCPNWPGFALGMDGGTQGVDVPTYTVWWGDIIRGSSGTSGLQYLRNRYYDPRTGRFTQLDPIGLAGGLNLYGFGGGDPVNFSDPFGLCPSCVGAALGVAGGFVVAKLLGQEYTLRDAAVDAALGAVGGGLVSKLGTIAKAARRTEEAVEGVHMVATAELRATHGVSRKSVDKLAKLVQRDGGITDPLKYVVDNGEKVIVDGNHRIRVARKLGIDQVPAERVSLPYKGFQTAADLIYTP